MVNVRDAAWETNAYLGAMCAFEGEERSLRAWDFVHCPPGTAHTLVAIGTGPCVILMNGRRGTGWPLTSKVVYPRSELALRHGVGVETEASSPVEAQAQLGVPGWRLERPAGWDELPWA